MKSNNRGRRQHGCFQCIHFYVTWDQRFPRGCKAMGFKSKELPAQVVLGASGMSCLRFEKKVTGAR